MLRSFVCAFVALALVVSAGFTADKGDKGAGKKKGHNYAGKIKAVDAEKGTFTLTVKNKKEPDGKDMEFKLAEDTKITVFSGDNKETLATKDALKSGKVKADMQAVVTADDAGKVTEVKIGQQKKAKKDAK
jgi:hypothetical protein